MKLGILALEVFILNESLFKFQCTYTWINIQQIVSPLLWFGISQEKLWRNTWQGRHDNVKVKRAKDIFGLRPSALYLNCNADVHFAKPSIKNIDHFSVLTSCWSALACGRSLNTEVSLGAGASLLESGRKSNMASTSLLSSTGSSCFLAASCRSVLLASNWRFSSSTSSASRRSNSYMRSWRQKNYDKQNFSVLYFLSAETKGKVCVQFSLLWYWFLEIKNFLFKWYFIKI